MGIGIADPALQRGAGSVAMLRRDVGRDHPDRGREPRGRSLNRITGAINVHFIEYTGLRKFYGVCKPAQKLF
jgi:hypothetical protein